MKPHTARAGPARCLKVFLLGLLTLTSQTLAQQPQTSEPPLLQLNQPLTATLKGGESHFYRLHAESGTLV
ncbi:MAG: hypothetical protein WAM70_08070, partial [Pyrinomonadaceae bacterium]